MITLLVVNELLFNKILYKVLSRLVIGKRSQSCQSLSKQMGIRRSRAKPWCVFNIWRFGDFV